MVPHLTPEEMDRFASWLEQEADTEVKLAEQLVKLGPAFTTLLTLHKTIEMAAFRVVASKLRAAIAQSNE